MTFKFEASLAKEKVVSLLITYLADQRLLQLKCNDIKYYLLKPKSQATIIFKSAFIIIRIKVNHAITEKGFKIKSIALIIYSINVAPYIG